MPESPPEGTTQGGYTSFDEAPALAFGPAIVLKPVASAQLMVSQVVAPPNQTAVLHTHAEEKIGFVVSGRCLFTLNAVSRELGPGDIYVVPPGVEHGFDTTDEPCVLVDVFTPPRPDLLERMRQAG